MNSSERNESTDLSLAATLVSVYSTFGLTLCGLVRSVLGYSGVPLSPLIAYVVLIIAMMGVFSVERRLKSRANWVDIKDRWFAVSAAAILAVIASPAVLGVLWPLAIWTNLSPAASGWLCVLPLMVLSLIIYRNSRKELRSGPD